MRRAILTLLIGSFAFAGTMRASDEPIAYDPKVPSEWVAQADQEADGGQELDGGVEADAPLADGGTHYCDEEKGICAVQTAVKYDGKLLPSGWWLSDNKVTETGAKITDLQNRLNQANSDVQSANASNSAGFWSNAKWFIYGFGIGGGTAAVTGLILAFKKK